MTMLDEGGITAAHTWANAQARLLRDGRFQAVDADARLALFQSYVRARRDIDSLSVSDDEKAFMVRKRRAISPSLLHLLALRTAAVKTVLCRFVHGSRC